MATAVIAPLTAGLDPHHRRRRVEPVKERSKPRRSVETWIDDLRPVSGRIGRRKSRRLVSETRLTVQARQLEARIRMRSEAGGATRQRRPRRTAEEELADMMRDEDIGLAVTALARSFTKGAILDADSRPTSHALISAPLPEEYNPDAEARTPESKKQRTKRKTLAASAALAGLRLSQSRRRQAGNAMWSRVAPRHRAAILQAARSRDVAVPAVLSATFLGREPIVTDADPPIPAATSPSTPRILSHISASSPFAGHDSSAGSGPDHTAAAATTAAASASAEDCGRKDDDGASLLAALELVMRVFSLTGHTPPTVALRPALASALAAPVRVRCGVSQSRAPAPLWSRRDAKSLLLGGVGGKKRPLPAPVPVQAASSTPAVSARTDSSSAVRSPIVTSTSVGSAAAATDTDAESVPDGAEAWLELKLPSSFHRRLAHGIAQYLGLTSRRGGAVELIPIPSAAVSASTPASAPTAAASVKHTPKRGERGARAARRRERLAEAASRSNGERCSVLICRTARAEATASGCFGAAAAALCASSSLGLVKEELCMLQTVSDAYGVESVLGGSSAGTRISRSALRAMAGGVIGDGTYSDGESSDGHSSAGGGGASPLHRTPSPVRGSRGVTPVSSMGVLDEDCGDPIAPLAGASDTVSAAGHVAEDEEDDDGVESE